MKTPDPDPSLFYDESEEFPGELTSESNLRQAVDPLRAILQEDIAPETDDERLYTDEFIRANEKASRSLFLGFLGIALLGTSLFAWFIYSQPKAVEDDPVDLDPTNSPTVAPDLPSVAPPNIDINQPPAFPPPQVPVAPTPSTPEIPSTFPITPTQPETGSQESGSQENGSQETGSPSSLPSADSVPGGEIAPPPPPQPETSDLPTSPTPP